MPHQCEHPPTISRKQHEKWMSRRSDCRAPRANWAGRSLCWVKRLWRENPWRSDPVLFSGTGWPSWLQSPPAPERRVSSHWMRASRSALLAFCCSPPRWSTLGRCRLGWLRAWLRFRALPPRAHQGACVSKAVVQGERLHSMRAGPRVHTNPSGCLLGNGEFRTNVCLCLSFSLATSS